MPQHAQPLDSFTFDFEPLAHLLVVGIEIEDVTRVSQAEAEDVVEVTAAVTSAEAEAATEVTPAKTEDATEVSPAKTEDPDEAALARAEDANEVTPAETKDANEVTPTEGSTEVFDAPEEDDKDTSAKNDHGSTCDQFGNVSPLNGNLKRHVKSVHGRTEFDCEECLTEMPKGGTFKKHMRPEHDIKLPNFALAKLDGQDQKPGKPLLSWDPGSQAAADASSKLLTWNPGSCCQETPSCQAAMRRQAVMEVKLPPEDAKPS